MRIHIEDQAAAAGTVVPARPLTRLLAAVEHPPAEFEPEAHDAPERAALRERGELRQSWKVDLVLDRAVFEAARHRFFQQGAALLGGRRHRLLGIDVLAGRDRLVQGGDTLLGRRRVEEDGVGRVRQGGVEIGGPVRHTVSARDGGNAVGVAADQQ